MPIAVPDKVKVAVDGQNVNVEGPKGKLSLEAHPMMKISVNDGQVIVERPDDSGQAKSLHGLTRSLINNMVVGVTSGYEKKLQIHGVGYRAEMKGSSLNMNLGFSHPVNFPLPEGVSGKVEDKTKINLESIDKQLLGATAAKIRSFRPPEPYGGKGIRYADEYVRRKEGKSGAK
jgi:large subunit ribosomal protein L6